jgi:hypothetical protein
VSLFSLPSKPSRTAEGLDHDARNDLSIFPDISEIEDFEHLNIPENFRNESEYLTRLFMETQKHIKMSKTDTTKKRERTQESQKTLGT